MYRHKPSCAEIPALPVTRVDVLDPPPGLTSLRIREPVTPLRYPDGHAGWLVTGYNEARTVLSDVRFSADSRYKRVPVVRPGSEPYMGVPAQPGWFIDMDPPEHTRFRRALAGAFTMRRLENLRSDIERVVDEQLSALRAAGRPADVVRHLAMPVPTRVICTLLGVPYALHEALERHSATLFSLGATADDAEHAMTELDAMLLDCTAVLRRHPADDVLSTLIGSGFGDREVAGAGVLLLTAGHETVASTAALSIYATAALFREQVRQGVTLKMVDELMRYLSIFQFGVPRSALEDIELGGHIITRGSSITVSLPAANRDPARFKAPDRFDSTRETRAHLAFGFGRHQCLGQHLARLEVEIILDRLWRAFPGLQVASSTTDLRFHDDVGFYGLHELPVTW